jgi:hypothetical protein
MTLKGFGWETYRVRAHSIPTSIANTDAYQCAERRMSKLTALSSPNKMISPTVNDTTSKREGNEPITAEVLGHFQFDQYEDSALLETKSKRSLTMPSSILLNSMEIPEIRSKNNNYKFKRFPKN